MAFIDVLVVQSMGPQCTLYIPAPILHSGDNELVIPASTSSKLQISNMRLRFYWAPFVFSRIMQSLLSNFFIAVIFKLKTLLHIHGYLTLGAMHDEGDNPVLCAVKYKVVTAK